MNDRFNFTGGAPIRQKPNDMQNRMLGNAPVDMQARGLAGELTARDAGFLAGETAAANPSPRDAAVREYGELVNMQLEAQRRGDVEAARALEAEIQNLRSSMAAEPYVSDEEHYKEQMIKSLRGQR